jgi:hypothetical protein
MPILRSNLIEKHLNKEMYQWTIMDTKSTIEMIYDIGSI